MVYPATQPSRFLDRQIYRAPADYCDELYFPIDRLEKAGIVTVAFGPTTALREALTKCHAASRPAPSSSARGSLPRAASHFGDVCRCSCAVPRIDVSRIKHRRVAAWTRRLAAVPLARLFPERAAFAVCASLAFAAGQSFSTASTLDQAERRVSAARS